MLRGLIVIVVILSGCCSQEKSTLKPSVIEGVKISDLDPIEDINEPTESEIVLLETDEYTPRTIEEKWLDFKKRSKFSKPENLLYFAEDLYDALEPRDNKRRMELSFYFADLSKKEIKKSKIVFGIFSKSFKINGGAAFGSFTEKSAIKSIMDQINRKGWG